jgi:hypothetical protein
LWLVVSTNGSCYPPRHRCPSAANGRADLTLAPGRYEYRFIVDGEWMADPLAKDFVPNPFGGQNSLLEVC